MCLASRAWRRPIPPMLLATLNDEQYVMRVHSLSPSAATAVKTDAGAISSDDANYLNRLDLVEGRWPHLGQRVRHLQRPRYERPLLVGGHGDG